MFVFSKVHFSTGCFMQKLYIFQTILTKVKYMKYTCPYSHCRKGAFDLPYLLQNWAILTFDTLYVGKKKHF